MAAAPKFFCLAGKQSARRRACRRRFRFGATQAQGAVLGALGAASVAIALMFLSSSVRAPHQSVSAEPLNPAAIYEQARQRTATHSDVAPAEGKKLKVIPSAAVSAAKDRQTPPKSPQQASAEKPANPKELASGKPQPAKAEAVVAKTAPASQKPTEEEQVEEDPIQLSVAAVNDAPDEPVVARRIVAPPVEVPAPAPHPNLEADDDFAVYSLQGEGMVEDTLIDPDFPERNQGSVARELVLVRDKNTNALLLRFDLEQVKLPPVDLFDKAIVGLHVWKPSPQGRTRLCAFSMLQSWNEDAATWRHADRGIAWNGGDDYSFSVGPGPASPYIVVEPASKRARGAAPVKYNLDVTEMVSAWLRGVPNHGMAISPIIDEQIDRGVASQFSIFASECGEVEKTPQLTLRYRRE